jgi:TonB-linked SusC/RagA family outer membrane protein
MNFIRHIGVLLVALISTAAWAQTVSGTVTDENNQPLPGATVIVQGTTTGTSTDFDGKYQINAIQGQTLVFSYVGYATQNVVVNSATHNVSLQLDNTLDEVIVVAYGTTTKEAFTGSASVIGSGELLTRNVTSPIAAIEGRATGVQFTSTNGQPGSSPDLVIRGVGTLNGDTDPLFIVDGVQYEGALNSINQEDIASFTILKDAASTSLYGSRAANGVVIITTKSGTKGGIKVNASAQTGFVTRGIPFHDRLSAGQYYETMWEALRNTTAAGGDPAYASANIYSQLGYNPFNVPNDQIVGTDGKLNPNAKLVYQTLDWFDFMQQTGQRQNYNVSVSAGGENHDVFFSTSYLNEEGYVVTSEFNRLTSRLNANFNVNEKIKIGGSANITITEARGPSSAGSGSIVNPFGFAQSMGPIYPVYVNDKQGNYVLDVYGNPIFDNGEGYSEHNIGTRPRNQGRNALQELLLNKESDMDNTYGMRFYTELELHDGLNLRMTYGTDINDGIEKEYENAIIGDAQPDGRFSEDRFRRRVENFNQVLTYNKSLNDHLFDVTVGHESFSRNFSDFDALGTIETVPGLEVFDNFSNPVSLGGGITDKRLEGYFSRINYNYDSKYFLSASIRRDGTSVFSSDYRWGTFYSIGASWNIHKENFMENVSFVDRLKLRGSWGEVGNDDLLDFYLYQARFGITSNATAPAFILSDLGNDLLVWETIENFDVALEFSLVNNLFEGSIEYYKKNSTELLFDLPQPPSVGINVQPNNIGDMYNSGWELSLTTHLFEKNDFLWDISLQATTLKNEITFIPEPFINGSKRWAEGRSRFDFFLYRTAGVDPATGDQLYYVYESNDDNESLPVLDADGNMTTTNDWQDTQRAYTGHSSVPDLLGSISNYINYKGFSLDFLITYGIGGSVLDNAYASMMSSSSYGRSQHPDILNAWRKAGDITDVPRLEIGDQTLIRTQSDRFLTNASFWSLKNVSIGYTLNKSSTDFLGIDGLTFSLTGENLFLKSKRKGLDPQYNLAGTPQGNDFNPAKIFSFGISVGF